MQRYTDFQGVGHIVASDSHFVEILKGEIRELRMQLLEKDKEVQVLEQEKQDLKAFLRDYKSKE